MAGMMYLGNQKVTPVIVQGGGSSETPVTIFKLADSVTEITESQRSVHLASVLPIIIDLNNLEIINSDGFFYYFAPINPHVSIRARNLKVLSAYGIFGEAFAGSSFDEFDFDVSTIEEISGRLALAYTFSECKNIPSVFKFLKLSILSGQYSLSHCFEKTNISEIYFNSLTSQSFGSYIDQFDGMIKGVADCTVHFPSNLESVIGEWDDVVAGFGGTNTTVLFDLEATS